MMGSGIPRVAPFRMAYPRWWNLGLYSYTSGLMFWLRRKTLVGSYLVLSATSRA